MSDKAIIKLHGVRKVYERGKQEIPVLDGIDLEIPEGSFEALMGPSGSGKTTLLNLIAGIDRPSAGSLTVANTDITRLSEGEMASFRARHIGFIF
ncbi:MAG TPA: ATP-binding cassette domain-containing protein, partial [Kofleriaceae bacterium]|nr:ATP-binding cassette domain-containing protein [Kofleriaceae bacterium]